MDSKPVSSIFKSMPQYIMVKNKIELGLVDPDSVIDNIEKAFPDATISRIDGIKLLWENSWVHIRKSNTEPIIRIYAEAITKLEADRIIGKVKSILQTIKL
jgi:phosphomannomutase